MSCKLGHAHASHFTGIDVCIHARVHCRAKRRGHSLAESGIFPAATRARLWISVFSLSSANLSLPDSTAFISRARISSGVQTLLRVVLLWTPDLFWGFGISYMQRQCPSLHHALQHLCFHSLNFHSSYLRFTSGLDDHPCASNPIS